MKLLFLLLFFLQACGGETLYVDSAFSASVERYLSQAPNRGHWKELDSIEYGNAGGELGHCERDKNPLEIKRKITISSELKGKSGSFIDSVVAHELAHCLHDKKHTENGLMAANIVSRSNDYWDLHLDEDIRALFE